MNRRISVIKIINCKVMVQAVASRKGYNAAARDFSSVEEVKIAIPASQRRIRSKDEMVAECLSDNDSEGLSRSQLAQSYISDNRSVSPSKISRND